MAIYPKATYRRTPTGPEPAIVPVGIIFHSSGSTKATSLYEWFASAAAKKVESHFHISNTGKVEQYRDTAEEADANYRGNSWLSAGRRYGYISIETQGDGSGPWTPAQLDALTALGRWLLATHPQIRHGVATSVYSGGLGWHNQFGAGPGTTSWSNAKGKICPGPRRIAQCREVLFPAILAPTPAAIALTLPEERKDLGEVVIAPATLKPGHYLTGPAGHRLVLQGDGNLVLYQPDGRPRWSTDPRRGDQLVIQRDGNMVLYLAGVAMWATDTTAPYPPSDVHLALQRDGVLALYQTGARFAV